MNEIRINSCIYNQLHFSCQSYVFKSLHFPNETKTNSCIYNYTCFVAVMCIQFDDYTNVNGKQSKNDFEYYISKCRWINMIRLID